jgi:hypothetical protein
MKISMVGVNKMTIAAGSTGATVVVAQNSSSYRVKFKRKEFLELV